MPDLSFDVIGAKPVANAVTPTLAMTLRVANVNQTQSIHSISLRCQIQIETPRRSYSPQEEQRLFDLFGPPERWEQTLRSMLWTHVNVLVPAFTSSVDVDLPVPCTFDFTIAATKYFDALQDGDVPLCLLFSGTIFYEGLAGALQVAQVPWDREAKFRLPVSTWRELIDCYYPNTAWLNLRKDVFDRLQEFKSRGDLPSWEQALERLLDASDAQVTP